jgi:hypothetical protein
MVCTEVYSGNNSVSHNLMKYKPKDSGKWNGYSWILTAVLKGSTATDHYYINNVSSDDWPFRNLMNNENYKKMFGLRLADLLFYHVQSRPDDYSN